MNTSNPTVTAGAITLNRAFGFNPKIAYELIRKTGSIGVLFGLPETERDLLLLHHPDYIGKLCDQELELSYKEYDRIKALGADFICIEDEDYPEALRECEDAPIGLYYKSRSKPSEFFSFPMISVVGTRDISSYGREWCPRIIQAIAGSPRRASIVSGLAFGVDAEAHKAAMSFGIPTLAVLPCGIDEVSPSSHWGLAESIRNSQNCALLSDFPAGYPVTKANFLRRNRIIAGLSSATILIESRKHGGGLITARTAFSYGREVYAMQGRIDDVRSHGCNNLIEEKIAEPIANIQTLGARLGLGRSIYSPKGSFAEGVEKYYQNLPPEMLEDLLSLSRGIEKNKGVNIEDLALDYALTYPRTLSLCTMLQKDGFIQIDLMQNCIILVKNA
ncbi:MAG: DNA-processing protein DprA [Candidatus Cryptobacteroides sp.]